LLERIGEKGLDAGERSICQHWRRAFGDHVDKLPNVLVAELTQQTPCRQDARPRRSEFFSAMSLRSKTRPSWSCSPSINALAQRLRRYQRQRRRIDILLRKSPASEILNPAARPYTLLTALRSPETLGRLASIGACLRRPDCGTRQIRPRAPAGSGNRAAPWRGW
jgi:hypothetical protein